MLPALLAHLLADRKRLEAHEAPRGPDAGAQGSRVGKALVPLRSKLALTDHGSMMGSLLVVANTASEGAESPPGFIANTR
jgi:hypothetical protein